MCLGVGATGESSSYNMSLISSLHTAWGITCVTAVGRCTSGRGWTMLLVGTTARPPPSTQAALLFLPKAQLFDLALYKAQGLAGAVRGGPAVHCCLSDRETRHIAVSDYLSVHALPDLYWG